MVPSNEPRPFEWVHVSNALPNQDCSVLMIVEHQYMGERSYTVQLGDYRWNTFETEGDYNSFDDRGFWICHNGQASQCIYWAYLPVSPKGLPACLPTTS